MYNSIGRYPRLVEGPSFHANCAEDKLLRLVKRFQEIKKEFDTLKGDGVREKAIVMCASAKLCACSVASISSQKTKCQTLHKPLS